MSRMSIHYIIGLFYIATAFIKLMIIRFTSTVTPFLLQENQIQWDRWIIH